MKSKSTKQKQNRDQIIFFDPVDESLHNQRVVTLNSPWRRFKNHWMNQYYRLRILFDLDIDNDNEEKFPYEKLAVIGDSLVEI